MARHRKKIFGTCAYCRKEAQLTEDHVIPQCLFGGNVPKDIPTVYACADCNGTLKSQGDTFLRDLLVFDMDTCNHPVARRLFDEKVTRAISSNQSALARYASDKLSPVEVFTPSGIFMGIAYATPLPLGTVRDVLAMIVRGLYLAYTGEFIPEHVHFEIQRLHNLQQALPIVKAAVQLGKFRYVAVGDSTIFNCVYGIEPGQPELSMWFLVFYVGPHSGMVFRVMTRPIQPQVGAEV